MAAFMSTVRPEQHQSGIRAGHDLAAIVDRHRVLEHQRRRHTPHEPVQVQHAADGAPDEGAHGAGLVLGKADDLAFRIDAARDRGPAAQCAEFAHAAAPRPRHRPLAPVGKADAAGDVQAGRHRIDPGRGAAADPEVDHAGSFVAGARPQEGTVAAIVPGSQAIARHLAPGAHGHGRRFDAAQRVDVDQAATARPGEHARELVVDRGHAGDQAGVVEHATGRLLEGGRDAQVFHPATNAPAERTRRVAERAGDDAAVVDGPAIRTAPARLGADVEHAAARAPDESVLDAVFVERGAGDLAGLVQVVRIRDAAAQRADVLHGCAVMEESRSAPAVHHRERHLAGGVDVGVGRDGAGAEIDHAVARALRAVSAVRLAGRRLRKHCRRHPHRGQ